jgi:MFS superfamily sulfate permease-like transporter
LKRYPKAKRFPGLLLFRWDAPLFFANAELFNDILLCVIEESPTPVHRVVIAAEPITSVDVTSADALVALDQVLAARGVELRFAELKDPVKDKLRRFGLLAEFGEERFHPTLESAVKTYAREQHAS